MITRYALFEGGITPDHEEMIRRDVMSEKLPVWRELPGAVAICLQGRPATEGGLARHFVGRSQLHGTTAHVLPL
jgi:hypothetical protein